MGWNEVDKKCKRRLDRAFVSCDEEYELEVVKRAVLEEIPGLSSAQVDEAIRRCCKDVAAPRPRKDFVACLKQRLS